MDDRRPAGEVAMLLGRIAATPETPGENAGPDFLPLVHARALRLLGLPGTCARFPVAPGQLGTALDGLHALGFRGVSLAPAHQVAALQRCARATPAAKALGRAGLVCFEDGVAVADDVLVEAIAARAALGLPSPGSGVVLGLGAGAGAAILALAGLGAEEITLAAEDVDSAARILAQLQLACPRTRLRLHARGASLQGELAVHADDGVSAPRLGLPSPEQVRFAIDLGCSTSAAPEWLAAFVRAGGRGEDGVGVLVRSGLAMLERWRGAPLPTGLEARIRAVVRAGGASAAQQPTA